MYPRVPIQLSPLARDRLRCPEGKTTAILVDYGGVLVAEQIEVDGQHFGNDISPTDYTVLADKEAT